MSDWPPNTVDSGYEPSPRTADNGRYNFFTYSSEEPEFFADNNTQQQQHRRCGGTTTMTSSVGYNSSSDTEYPRDHEDVVSLNELVEGSKSTNSVESRKSSAAADLKWSTPTVSRFGGGISDGFKSPLAATPPISIPNRKMDVNSEFFLNLTPPPLPPVLTAAHLAEDLRKSETNQADVRKKHHLQTDILQPLLDSSEDEDSSEIGFPNPMSPRGFRRVRTNTCPPSFRSTPTRRPVPLFQTIPTDINASLSNSENRYTVFKPNLQSSKGSNNYDGQIVHTRNRSTPATILTGGNDYQRPNLHHPLPPLPPPQQPTLQSDISDDGHGEVEFRPVSI